MADSTLANTGGFSRSDWTSDEFKIISPAPAATDGLSATSTMDEIVRGLSAPQKKLPTKLFYDERGSQLFDDICNLSEYYVTRTETALMESHADEIAAELGTGAMLIEYGSGSSTKTRVLLSHLDRPAGYVPIDISAEHLIKTARALRREYPGLEIHPLAADFTQPFTLPASVNGSFRENPNRVIYFPGSTIGNFERHDATELLMNMAHTLEKGGRLLIGVDLDKDPDVLQRAYDDSLGVTAEFNRNILVRLNREFGCDFDVGRFEHRAVYDAQHSRVEMHLVSLVPQTATVCGKTVTFERGETILTEYSHKYTISAFTRIAVQAGFLSRRVWTDPAELFSVHLLDVAP